MTTLAAIDAGSNAMRLVIGRAGRNGGVEVVKNGREAVRLGKDVFASGRMSRKLMKAAAASFGRFRETIDEWGVEHTVAVGYERPPRGGEPGPSLLDHRSQRRRASR